MAPCSEASQLLSTAHDTFHLKKVCLLNAFYVRFYPHFEQGGSSLGTLSSSTRFEDNSVVLGSSSDAVKLNNQFYGCVRNFQMYNAVFTPATFPSSEDPDEQTPNDTAGKTPTNLQAPNDTSPAESGVVSSATRALVAPLVLFSFVVLLF